MDWIFTLILTVLIVTAAVWWVIQDSRKEDEAIKQYMRETFGDPYDRVMPTGSPPDPLSEKEIAEQLAEKESMTYKFKL